MTQVELDKSIIECNACNLCQLDCNNCAKYYEGKGKLLAWSGFKPTELMIIGMNPSHKRWRGLQYHFSGGGTFNNPSYDKNVGAKFLKILSHLKVLDKCVVTNLVKCSTVDNKIDDTIINACFKHVRNEIEFYKPKYIIGCGTQVNNKLEQEKINNLIKINHPNYYFTYRPSQLKDYIVQIYNILKEKGVIQDVYPNTDK